MQVRGDVNSWVRAVHAINEHWSLTNNDEFTVSLVHAINKHWSLTNNDEFTVPFLIITCIHHFQMTQQELLQTTHWYTHSTYLLFESTKKSNSLAILQHRDFLNENSYHRLKYWIFCLPVFMIACKNIYNIQFTFTHPWNSLFYEHLIVCNGM
jgi:hypothetical protein